MKFSIPALPKELESTFDKVFKGIDELASINPTLQGKTSFEQHIALQGIPVGQLNVVASHTKPRNSK